MKVLNAPLGKRASERGAFSFRLNLIHIVLENSLLLLCLTKYTYDTYLREARRGRQKGYFNKFDDDVHQRASKNSESKVYRLPRISADAASIILCEIVASELLIVQSTSSELSFPFEEQKRVVSNFSIEKGDRLREVAEEYRRHHIRKERLRPKAKSFFAGKIMKTHIWIILVLALISSTLDVESRSPRSLQSMKWWKDIKPSKIKSRSV